jgi:hypothetical protein
MKDTTSHRDLEQRIEQLVREHIAAVQRSAREAIERAFGGSGGAARKPTQTVAAGAATGGRRRARGELTAVAERLYRAVCAHPGEGIVALAAELGMSARELQRPMGLLRESGRVRSVGQRHLMRYYPRTGASQ